MPDFCLTFPILVPDFPGKAGKKVRFLVKSGRKDPQKSDFLLILPDFFEKVRHGIQALAGGGGRGQGGGATGL